MQLIRLGAPEVGPKGAQVGLGCIYVCEGVYVCVCARASIGEEMKLLYRLRMVAMVKIKKKKHNNRLIHQKTLRPQTQQKHTITL